MKFRTALLATGLLFGLRSILLAQTTPVSGGTGGVTTQPVISGAPSSSDRGGGFSSSTTGAAPNGRGASGQDPSTGSPENKSAYEETNTDEKDDALYRGKTDTTDNPMIRDEGPLHYKTRKKEKVQEVDSVTNLQRGATDKNFEGSLLHSSVTSINDVVPAKGPAASEAKPVNPRFSKKELTFVREKSDGKPEAQKDSSPSPTPSATASARTTDKKN